MPSRDDRDRRPHPNQPSYGYPTQHSTNDMPTPDVRDARAAQRQAKTASDATIDRLEGDARQRMRGVDDLKGGLPGTVVTPGNEATAQNPDTEANLREPGAGSSS